MSDTVVKERRVVPVPFANNLLTNPGFAVWQRGVGPFVISQEPTADEWYNAAIGADTVSTARTAGLFGAYALQTTWTTLATRGIYQALEAFKSLEGNWITFSCWVKTTSDAVRVSALDYTTSSETSVGTYHSGSGNWELLTVSKLIRTGLVGNPSWEHSYGVRVGVQVVAGVTATLEMDGATCAVGNFPQGLQFVPPNPSEDLRRCERYYQTSGSGDAWARGTLWNGKCFSGGQYRTQTGFRTVMAATPSLSLTHTGTVGFDTVSTPLINSPDGFSCYRVCTANQDRGYFRDDWVAEVL